MKRNEILVHIFTLALVILLTAAVYYALTDSREGLTAMSAGLEDRVSYKYLLKTSEMIPVEMGQSGYENGAVNIVAAVVADYRILDTFGGTIFLFAVSAGVLLLMEKRKKRKKKEAGIILQTAAPAIMLFALVAGFYIILHGHLSPGGGFPGGAVIASAFIIQCLGFKKDSPRRGWLMLLVSLAGLGLLAVGLSGLYIKGSFFANFLPTGSLGETFSAGSIMIVYILIGIKTASELSSITADFIGA